MTDPEGASTSDQILITVIEEQVISVKGDLDGDGVIDMDDYNAFRSTLGKCEGVAGYINEADYDGDGCVSYRDYRMWYGLFLNQNIE